MEEQTPISQQTPQAPVNQPEVMTNSKPAVGKSNKNLFVVIGVLVLAAIVIAVVFVVAYPKGDSEEDTQVTTTPSKEIRSNSDLDKASADLDKADADFSQIEAELNKNDQDSSQF